ETLARRISSVPELRDELLRRYRDPGAQICHGLIERCFEKSPDNACLLAMVRRYAEVRRQFDGLLSSTIEHLVLEKRAAPQWKGAYELHSVDAIELRKELFALTLARGRENALATACLTAIDRIRDEHGRPGEEPRHPDIATGRPW